MRQLCTGAVLVLAISGVVSQSPWSRRTPFQQLLHKTIRGVTPATRNVVFSPYSVATALTMLREAAAGPNRREITDVLGRGHQQALQTNVQQRGVTLKLWDAFYYDTTIGVKYDYQRALRKMGASVRPQPFVDRPDEAVADINADVSRETMGMVRRLLPEADPDMVAVLVSAIYFRAEWKTAFDIGRTRPRTFTTADGRRQKVAMVAAEDQYRYLRSEQDAFASVAIPYKEERFQMILVLPDKGADISDVLNRFDVDLMYKDMRMQQVTVKFPKFRVKNNLPLADILKKLGIEGVFSQPADLTHMSADPRLYVSSVRHTATIETDEAGSVAAAASAVGISARSFFTPPTPTLIANRPFLFFVYDVDTANVLFSGQIQDAAEAQSAQSTPEPQPEKVLALDLVPPQLVELESRQFVDLEPQPVVLGQNAALDSQLQLEPDSSVETLPDQPGLLDSLQEVLGKQTAGRAGGRRGGRRGGLRGRGRAPSAPSGVSAPSGSAPSGVSGPSGSAPSGVSGPSGPTGATATGPAFTGPSGGGVRGPNRRRNRPPGRRRPSGRQPNRRFNRRQQQQQQPYRPPPPPPPPLPPPRRRRPPPPRRRPPPPRRRPPPPRPRRPPPPPRPRHPRPPPAVPGSRYNPACNCHEPPVYTAPTASAPRDQRIVNINFNKHPTPLVSDIWAATPTASLWSPVAATTDPLLWGTTSSLWPSTSLWANPLATSSIIVP